MKTITMAIIITGNNIDNPIIRPMTLQTFSTKTWNDHGR